MGNRIRAVEVFCEIIQRPSLSEKTCTACAVAVTSRNTTIGRERALKICIGVPLGSYVARTIRLIPAISLLGVALAVPLAHSAQNAASAAGPSFSCASAASAIETMICSDTALAARDRTMTTLFNAAQTDAFGQGMSQQRILQRRWLKDRNERCSDGDMRTCILGAYDDRLKELAVAALFQAPKVALEELTREDPKSAPLYKAIYRYAIMTGGADRTAVEKLIGPAFKELSDKPWARPLADVTDANDTVSSDENFSVFLDVASVGGYALTMPCAALVRRPGLMGALDTVYGGAIDGQLILSDCEAMTSPLENVDRLTKVAVLAQPSCEGTIRFSLGRDFDKMLVAIRLHRTDLWKITELDASPRDQDDTGDDSAKDVDEPHFVEAHQVLRSRATDELAAYYSTHFNVPPALAEKQALSAINAIISGAYNLCEKG
jgi:uncharacterized protein